MLVSVTREAWIAGVSTRWINELIQAMGMSGIERIKCLSGRALLYFSIAVGNEWEGRTMRAVLVTRNDLMAGDLHHHARREPNRQASLRMLAIANVLEG